MLVPHVALRFECRIHSYGAISTTIRRQLGWIKEDQESPEAPEEVVVVEEEESEFVRVRRKNWRRLIAKVWLDDPQLCRGCGKPMRVISAISSPHQDDIIEKILRHGGHNTSRPLVTIHYPFHPLVGTQFRPVQARSGPPPVYVIQLPDGRLAVPTWMAEEWTSTLQLSELPTISAEKLLELASLVKKTLDDLQSTSCIVSENSNSTEDDDDGQIPSASPSNGSDDGGETSPAARSRRGHRLDGRAASSNPQRRGGKGGRK
jgi:hypothetical protein